MDYPLSRITIMWLQIFLQLLGLYGGLADEYLDSIPPGTAYCSTETFTAKCAQDEIVLITSALYGRMRLSNCVKVNFGYIGCYSNVILQADLQCSGRHNCEIRIPDASFDATQPCLGDLTRYFEVDYQCVKVVSTTRQQCESSYAVTVPGPSGYIASIVTKETGCGTRYRPWVIEVQPSQRVNITLYDFSVMSSSEVASSLCVEYFVIREQDPDREVRICGGETRVKHVYLSTTNKVKIEMTSYHSETQPTMFAIYYEAVGCPDPNLPSNMWLKHEADHVIVGCSASLDRWRLECHGNTWFGHVGNCSGTAAPRATKLEEMFSGIVTSLPNGYAIMIIIGIAVLISIAILVFGLIYLRRKRNHRQKKTRCTIATGRHQSYPETGKDIYYAKCAMELEGAASLSRTYQRHHSLPSGGGGGLNEYAYETRGQWPHHGDPPPYQPDQERSPVVEHIYESPVFERREPAPPEVPTYFELDSDIGQRSANPAAAKRYNMNLPNPANNECGYWE